MEFDFSTILAEAQGALTWLYTVIGATGLGTIIGLIYKAFKTIKSGKDMLDKNTSGLEGTVKEAVAKALPSDMTIKVQAVAQREFNELCEKLNDKFADSLEKQKDNEKLLKDIATALLCLKSIPTSVKDKLVEDIGDKVVEAENKLILSLIPSVGEKKEEEVEQEAEIKVEQEAYIE